MREKRKSGVKFILFLFLFLLILIGGCVWYFGFANHDSRIAIREYLAEKSLEADKTERAIALYEDILDYDSVHVPAYLALGDIYMQDRDYENAQKILETGLSECRDEDVAEALWNAYLSEARRLEKKEDWDGLVERLETIPEEKLAGVIDDPKTSGELMREDAASWTGAKLQLGSAIMESGDAEATAAFFEAAMAEPLNEKVDTEQFRHKLVESYLQLGDEAYDADDWDAARGYYGKVLEIDPENARAQDGLAKMVVPEEEEEETGPELVSADAVIDLGLTASYFGISIDVPATVELKLSYDGRNSGSEYMLVTEKVSVSAAGKKQEQTETIELSQNGKDILIKTGGETRTEANSELKREVWDFLREYEQIAASQPESGSDADWNGKTCAVTNGVVDGKDYSLKLPGGVLDANTKKLLESLTMDVTRYVNRETGLPVHVEVTLLTVDNSALKELMGEYLGEFSGVEMKLKTMTLKMDIKIQ